MLIISSSVCVIVLVALLTPFVVQAHSSEINSISLKTTIDDMNYTLVHNVAVTCTDDILVYGLNLFAPHNDPEDHYTIKEDTIRLGVTTLAHPSHIAAHDHMSANLLEGMEKYPILFQQYNPLIIPIQVIDDKPGISTEVTLDITYLGNPGTTCQVSEIRGMQKVGLMTWTTIERGMDRIVVANMAVNDYNQYLESIGEQWRLELVVKDSGLQPETALERAQEFLAEDIRLIIGPASSGSINEIWDYTHRNGMVVISCCSTAPSLAIPDHIFRTTPDDTNQSKALGKIITDDNISSIVVVHRNDSYGQELNYALGLEMERRGGMVIASIPYPIDANNYDDISQMMVNAIRDVDNVAVVAVSSSEIVDIIESSMKHDILDNIRWYGSEAVVNHRSIAQGDVGAFAERVGLTGVIVDAPYSPLRSNLEPRLVTELNLQPGESPSIFLYSMYDAILIMAKSIMATQSTDIERLLEAIPYVAAHTHGVMPNTFNESGDLATTNYGIWKLKDMIWVRTGTFVQDTDTILPYVQ